MTKLSIALATAVLTVSLAPAASAYSTEPVFTVTNAAVTTTQTADAGEICVSRITPELAEALALPKTPAGMIIATLACAAE